MVERASAVGSERKLAAIMFTDIAEFSRQMGADEARMLRLLELHNQLIHHAVSAHHGHVIKTIGDAFLVDFPSVVNAVQCAQVIQAQLRAHNAEKNKAEQIHVRIGIHLGDIIQRDGDVFGDGVNIAARLQSLAEPDTICISHKVYEEVAKKLALGTLVSLGKPKLKHIAERFHVYALLPETPRGVRRRLQVQRLKLKPFSASLATVGLLLVGGILALLLFRFPPAPSVGGHSTVRNQEALPLPDKPSIVVLPFTNMSNDPEQEYFSDGITEDLTTALSQMASLFVIARNSAFTYKGKAVNVRNVGRELGVRYVLEGSVRRANEQVRITAQLVEAPTGSHIWAERYDRPLQDIFALQDEIVQQIVTTLRLQLTLQEQGISVRKHTNNMDAYDAFLQGMEYTRHSTKESNTQARQRFQRATELDPLYAEAYAWLGYGYWLEWYSQWNQGPQILERAFVLAQKALALDGSLPVAHSVLSLAYMWKKQHTRAVTEGERAVALAPNNADSLVWLARILVYVGRAQEAIKLVRQAMRLNPHYPPLYTLHLGVAYHYAWQNEEAIATLKQYLLYNPDHVSVHTGLACSYSDIGREEEARAEVAEILRLSPQFSLEAWSQSLPVQDPKELERHVNNARKAGLK